MSSMIRTSMWYTYCCTDSAAWVYLGENVTPLAVRTIYISRAEGKHRVPFPPYLV